MQVRLILPHIAEQKQQLKYLAYIATYNHTHSQDLHAMLSGLLSNPNYKDELGRRFWSRLNPPDKRVPYSYDEIAKCMIALGKRQLAMEVMPHVLLGLTIDTRPKKKRRWLRRAE